MIIAVKARLLSSEPGNGDFRFFAIKADRLDHIDFSGGHEAKTHRDHFLIGHFVLALTWDRPSGKSGT